MNILSIQESSTVGWAYSVFSGLSSIMGSLCHPSGSVVWGTGLSSNKVPTTELQQSHIRLTEAELSADPEQPDTDLAGLWKYWVSIDLSSILATSEKQRSEVTHHEDRFVLMRITLSQRGTGPGVLASHLSVIQRRLVRVAGAQLRLHGGWLGP